LALFSQYQRKSEGSKPSPKLRRRNFLDLEVNSCLIEWDLSKINEATEMMSDRAAMDSVNFELV
jgi:hypothetical protein